MKIKMMKTIIPVVSGIIIILGILILLAFIREGYIPFTRGDKLFFDVFVPCIAIIAMIIQLTLAIPVREKYKHKKKFIGLTIIPFTGLISLIGGLIFGFVFWETIAGLKDLIAESLLGIIVFIVYWTVNAFTLKLIERKI